MDNMPKYHKTLEDNMRDIYIYIYIYIIRNDKNYINIYINEQKKLTI